MLEEDLENDELSMGDGDGDGDVFVKKTLEKLQRVLRGGTKSPFVYAAATVFYLKRSPQPFGNKEK